MLQLIESARDFYLAGGFTERRSSPGFVELERNNSVKIEQVLIWTDAFADEFGSSCRDNSRDQEALLLASFEREMAAAPGATGIFLVSRRLGLTRNFISATKTILGDKGGIRTPIEFFDSAYKTECSEGRRARSVLSNILTEADRIPRVSQQFSIRHGANLQNCRFAANDLVSHLQRSVSEKGPKLRIIQGSAGGGKSVAFNALVASLHHDFRSAKRAREYGRRPIMFLPEHLRSAHIGYVEDIIEAVMKTEVADAVSTEQFRWLLLNGHSVWLFDGLDEFYAGSADFCSFLDTVLSTPGSQAQIVICTRDSLLNSNPAFRAFVETKIADGIDIEIFELAHWKSASWREYARVELEKAGVTTAQDEVACQFQAAIEKSAVLAELAELPFYCKLLFEVFIARQNLDIDELDAIEFIIAHMLDREQGKNIFRWDDFVDMERLSNIVELEFSKGGLVSSTDLNPRAMLDKLLVQEGRDILLELIGSVAHERYTGGNRLPRNEGISVDDIKQLVGLAHVPFRLNAEVLRRLQTVLVQFAFFGPGRSAGYIDFTHPILGEYLAGRHAAIVLRRGLFDCTANSRASNPTDRPSRSLVDRAMQKALGDVKLIPNSLFERALSREVERDQEMLSTLYSVSASTGSAGREATTGSILNSDV